MKYFLDTLDLQPKSNTMSTSPPPQFPSPYPLWFRGTDIYKWRAAGKVAARKVYGGYHVTIISPQPALARTCIVTNHTRTRVMLSYLGADGRITAWDRFNRSSGFIEEKTKGERILRDDLEDLNYRLDAIDVINYAHTPINPAIPDTSTMPEIFNSAPETRSPDSFVYDALVKRIEDDPCSRLDFDNAVEYIFKNGGYIHLDAATGLPCKDKVGSVLGTHKGDIINYAHTPIYSRTTGKRISYLSIRLTRIGCEVSGMHATVRAKKCVWRKFTEPAAWAEPCPKLDNGHRMMKAINR